MGGRGEYQSLVSFLGLRGGKETTSRSFSTAVLDVDLFMSDFFDAVAGVTELDNSGKGTTSFPSSEDVTITGIAV
jgi:hypothetical protein